MRIGNCKAVLLTGGRGVGKTTVCQAVAALARRRGYRPGGVITPALYDGGVKVGFEALDVGGGERWLLARTDPSTILRPLDPSTAPSTLRLPLRLRSGQALLRASFAQGKLCSGQGSGHRRELGGPRVGPYSFDPAGLARALGVLREALTAGTSATAPCDLIIVDEIGPLELEQGEGFAPILDLLPAAIGHLQIVVRPALLDQLLWHLRGVECTVFSVTEENRNELPLEIVKALWGDG